jgi:pimeloyl-ACP methyl ester carboxylesterase
MVMIGVGYLAICGYLWGYQKQFIFHPVHGGEDTPTGVGLGYEEVWLAHPGQAQEALNAWWVPQIPGSPVVLYLHGNASNLAGNLEHVGRLRHWGLTVFAVDYRGYGRSGGQDPSEAKVYEDAELAWTHLVATRQVRPGDIFIYGHSLGAAVAMEMAVRHPQAAGLIMESSFTSMVEMARRKFRLFPVDYLLHERFDSIAKVPRLRMPVLFIHGTADRTIPPAMSELLFALAPEPKRLLLVPGAHHDDCAIVGADLYGGALQQFVRRGAGPARLVE